MEIVRGIVVLEDDRYSGLHYVDVLHGTFEQWRQQKGLVLQYQLHNRVENLADVLTRCSGLLQGALKKTRASGQIVGKVFNPVAKLVLENQPFLMPEPAEKPSLR